MIKPIDKTSIHRLCSGQVVLTLATAVKELVENSLDAGAKNISVRCTKSGLEKIEVSDDGCGVEENNFEALTLKHHTSKISDFKDLVDVDTFGFRGEALSSLCALSKLSITTRHVSKCIGTRLLFNNNGDIVSRSPCARQPGTTVLVVDLFHTLPVRRKELEKNINKEFSKMLSFLSGYCLIQKGLKLTITNQAKDNGSSGVMLRVSGNSTIKDNIIDVFGVKQVPRVIVFNMGFIISSLDDDLFIIDQHASDEKFNFERLQRTVTLQSQKLIQPLALELTACNECTLLDNIHIFRKNGFEFVINRDACPSERVQLTSLPTSKNWAFGPQDGVMCRPSRIRQMLASRACRSSVMIGTALNHSEMRKLVDHMGEIDQPWNCPHGRPTIRHLIDMNMLKN
ncbi:hypothetical protein HELRODRAFT_157945 [Helobdella robusta]|uniref:MutL C-terminal dimerisation domain-containing protein n=1 Tax=Helobdella robusta TaxID=6412 RepID=T1EMH9_HELRO|nr:hypothetical protein HELRODRAFT_157945 [Helobdella robusta]ESN92320.1 hypothetical protein HELRODRAFT_157945 [Helobdella robusta]